MRIQFILVICAMIGFSGCALDRDVKQVERRLSQLEIENQSLQNKIQRLKTDIESRSASENSLRDMYAGQGAEFQSYKEDISRLNGRLDETEYRLNQGIGELTASMKNNESTIDHFSQTVSENQNRIQRIENFVGFEPGGESSKKDQTKAPAEEKLSEDELYKVSKQAYDRSDFETARQGFTKFLELYPKSNMADNARFWIGEIYFTEGWYQKAILEYQVVIENYPKGNKIQSAYLKQGIAFHKLGETANALLVLKELIKKYPDSNEAGIARKQVAQIE